MPSTILLFLHLNTPSIQARDKNGPNFLVDHLKLGLWPHKKCLFKIEIDESNVDPIAEISTKSYGTFSFNSFNCTNTSITRWSITWNQNVVAWWYQYVSSTWKASNIVDIQYKIHSNTWPWGSPINYNQQTFELLPSIATSLYPLMKVVRKLNHEKLEGTTPFMVFCVTYSICKASMYWFLEVSKCRAR